MPIFSDDIIEDVRQRNDIVDVISGYVRLQKKGSSHFGLCPFHNEKSPSFSVSQSKQMYYCFGCGAGGNVFTFLMNYENDTFPEAIKTLADRAGINLPEIEYSEEMKKEADKKALLLEINKEAARYFYYQLRSPQGQIGHQYLTKRELSEETMKQFGLGYSNKYSNDLVQYLKQKGYKLLGTCARIVKSKGISQVLLALKELPNHAFVIIGDGLEKDVLIQTARQLEVVDRVLFLSHVDAPYNYLEDMDKIRI